jgi:hypothetical protein
MHNPAIAALKRLVSISALGLALIGPASGEDRMMLGPKQFETDKSGAGAVLCLWSIYLASLPKEYRQM